MSRRRIRLLMWKEFLQLRRDPMLVRLLLLMPILQLILFGYVVAAEISHLDTAVVDLDQTTTSRALEASFTSWSTSPSPTPRRPRTPSGRSWTTATSRSRS